MCGFLPNKWQDTILAIPNDIPDDWGERWDLNPRPPVPQTGALTN